MVLSITDADGVTLKLTLPLTIALEEEAPPPPPPPPPPPQPEPLWFTDHSDGLNSWNETVSGNAAASVGDVAHSGDKSAKLTVQGSGGIRMRVDSQSPTGQPIGAPDNLPDDGLYSAWYYFPSDAATQENSNIFQFKQAETKADGTSQTRRLLHFVRADREGDQLRLHLRGKMDHETGEWNAAGQTFSIAKAPVTFPFDTWVNLQVRYKWAKDRTGIIQGWLNGVKVFDVRDIVTELDVPYIGYPRQATWNHYYSNGGTSHIYLDDVGIWRFPA